MKKKNLDTVDFKNLLIFVYFYIYQQFKVRRSPVLHGVCNSHQPPLKPIKPLRQILTLKFSTFFFVLHDVSRCQDKVSCNIQMWWTILVIPPSWMLFMSDFDDHKFFWTGITIPIIHTFLTSIKCTFREYRK